MDVREKLTHILTSDPEMLKNLNVSTIRLYRLVDKLISNGVTVQEWISVKDRLPDGDSYILVSADGIVQYAYWHNDRFYSFTAIGIVMIYRVTHWMPLPQPPKGE